MRFVQDVYNASDLLRCGSGSGSSGSGSGIQSASSSSSANVLAVQAFYQPLNYPDAANNSDDAAGLWVALADGAGSLQFSSGAEHLSQWSAFEAADEAFGITGALGCADKMCVGDVAQRYFQPAENFNMSIYPDGWQQPQARPPAPPHAQEEGLLLPGFRPAVPRAAGAFADGLAIKAPMPLTLRQQLPVQFLNVTSSSDKRWWSYVVDFGCNFQVRALTYNASPLAVPAGIIQVNENPSIICQDRLRTNKNYCCWEQKVRCKQGGLNVSFSTPDWAAGRIVHVRTGETLCSNGSVAYYISRTRGKVRKTPV
jgi:hypothetical protein